jgi:5,5'-dehydrodivanillate O-demethylase oxygenase subunit
MRTTAERTTITNDDLARTAPGTLAGRYLRLFWQPVARVADVVTDWPLPVRIMNEDLTVYRGASGQVHVVAGRCPHRGSQLSSGWVEGEALRCRYHGWKFDANGQCVEQPGEDPAFAQKTCIRSYPAQEYLGLVFAYLGDGAPPPLRRFPDFERPGVVEAGPPELWPCNYFNRIDNACDPGHLAFAHRESLRRSGLLWSLGIRTITAEETEYGVRTAETVPDRPVSYLHFHMPNVNQVRGRGRVEGTLQDAATLYVDRLFFRVPVDDTNCVSFTIDFLPLTGAEAEAYRGRRRESQNIGLATLNDVADDILHGKQRMEHVDKDLSTYKLFWLEDYTVQVGQGPIADRDNEHLGRMDAGVILLRKIWRRELQAFADGKPLTAWVTPSGLIDMNVEAAP